MATCPNNHASQASDFCSVCGIEVSPAGSTPAASAAREDQCPTCGAKRSGGDGDFCEVCGYNFKTGVCSVPFAPPSPPQQPLSSAAPGVEPAAGLTSSESGEPAQAEQDEQTAPVPAEGIELRTWRLVAVIDLSIMGVSEEEGPADRTERVFPLDLPDQLIGRRSARRNVQPEISLDGDDGVSHRHARILRQPDGGFALLDLGSSNGTLLNGRELTPNVLTPLAEGDRIGLGRWTCLTVQSRASSPARPPV